MNNTVKLVCVCGLVATLSGCFFTKFATTPMRIVGAGAGVVGAFASIIPGAGNTIDETLEKVDGAIDTSADTIDVIPL